MNYCTFCCCFLSSLDVMVCVWSLSLSLWVCFHFLFAHCLPFCWYENWINYNLRWFQRHADFELIKSPYTNTHSQTKHTSYMQGMYSIFSNDFIWHLFFQKIQKYFLFLEDFCLSILSWCDGAFYRLILFDVAEIHVKHMQRQWKLSKSRIFIGVFELTFVWSPI